MRGAARHPPPYCAKRVVLQASGVARRAWCRPPPTAVLRETRGFAGQRGAHRCVVPPATHRSTARNAWFCRPAGWPEGRGAAPPPTAVLRETRGFAGQRGGQKGVVQPWGGLIIPQAQKQKDKHKDKAPARRRPLAELLSWRSHATPKPRGGCASSRLDHTLKVEAVLHTVLSGLLAVCTLQAICCPGLGACAWSAPGQRSRERGRGQSLCHCPYSAEAQKSSTTAFQKCNQNGNFYILFLASAFDFIIVFGAVSIFVTGARKYF